MKFLLAMNAKRSDWESLSAWSPGDFKRHIDFMHAFNADLASSGELVLAEGLDVPANARVVTAAPDAPPIVSDGPFPETKEFLAGFWIVDVDTPQRAIEIAAAASAAPGPGGAPLPIPIEVRRVMSGPPETP
jgi:hypothetical protein